MAALAMPILGVIASIFALISKRQPSWIAFSISLALIYSYLPLLWDARNNFVYVFLSESKERNFYTYIIELLVYHYDLEYISVIALIGAIVIYCFSKIIGRQLVESQKQRGLQFYLVLLLLLLALDYRTIFGLQKTAIALGFYLVGLDARSAGKRYGFFAISALLHPFTLALVVIVPLAGFITKLSTRAIFSIFLCGVTVPVILSPELLAYLALNIEFMPSKLVYYFSNIDFTIYSSEFVSILVWFLRVLACGVVALVSIFQMRKSEAPRERWLLGILFCAAILNFCVSRNEVMLERYFFALVILSTYAAAQVRFSPVPLVCLVAALLMNVSLHGIYTLQLVHTEAYEVILTAGARQQISLRGLSFPFFMLLDHHSFGYSNELIASQVQ